MFAAIDHEAFVIGGYQKGRDAFFAQLRVGDGEDDGQPGTPGIADELLGAVDHPVLALQLGAGAQVVGFGAGLRLGQAEAANHLPAGQAFEPGLLLLGVAIGEQGAAAHRIVDAHQRAGGAIAGGDLLDRQGIGDIVGVAAAPLLGHDHAEQAQLAHLLHHAVIDPAGLFPGLGMGGDFAAGEIPGHVADHDLFFSQFQVLHLRTPGLRGLRRIDPRVCGSGRRGSGDSSEAACPCR
ncbi:hypothetical protein D3C77_375250 [compost metagenome]